MFIRSTLLQGAAILLLASCGNMNTKQDTDTVTKVDLTSTAGDTPENTSDLNQIHTQDTLFEDGTVPASWGNAGFKDPVAFKKFIVQFKDWVKNDRKEDIAKHIRFPLKGAKTAEEFKAGYAQIFDQKLKDKVAHQRIDRIFRNQQGAMIGNGAIWFASDGDDYVIIGINK